MTKAEFRQQISAALNATLEDGPGSRAVALITGRELTKFIMNEAGGDAPAAVQEVAETHAGHDQRSARTRTGVSGTLNDAPCTSRPRSPVEAAGCASGVYNLCGSYPKVPSGTGHRALNIFLL
jgi:hypothetical protein